MDHLHWRRLLAKPPATVTSNSINIKEFYLCNSYYCTCLGHLGRCYRDRIIYTYVMPPKVAKASRYVAVAVPVTCHCRWHFRSKLRQCKHDLRRYSGDEHASLSRYNCKKFCIACPDSKNVHLVSTIRQFFKKFELRDKNIHSSSLSYKAVLPVFSLC